MFKEQTEDSTEDDEVVNVENPESEDTVSSQQPDSTDIPEDTNKEYTTTADGDNNLVVMGIGLLGLITILVIVFKRKENNTIGVWQTGPDYFQGLFYFLIKT